MKKTPVLLAAILIFATFSCGKRVPQIANTIPDHAFAVATIHPKQIFQKGQISNMESFTQKINNEMLKQMMQDPQKSGIDIAEYAYLYVYFLHDKPVIGFTAALDDASKFAAVIDEMSKVADLEVQLHEGYSMITPDNEEAGMAWNEEQVIFLLSPDNPYSADTWQNELISLYELEKENSVTSIVDFVDFSGKMKDMNLWFTGDELQNILESSGATKNMDFQLPVELYNNYVQLFVEFADGAMYITSETHFSDDVVKAASSMMVAKEEMNDELLKLTPGNELLLALAFSVEMDNLVNLVQGASPPELDSVSGKIEKATGVPGNEILEALSGDFVIAVNGAQEGASIPVEILIGIGLDDKSLQKKIMGKVDNMADVQEEGDFFMINANGIELYSGIVEGIWVITNTPGYKDAVTGDGLEKTLLDSKFEEYADGSMGMYMNLDRSTYPAPLQSMLSRNKEAQMLQMVTESFVSLGVEASKHENVLTLKSSNSNENSLYTLLQILENAAARN